MSHINNQHVRKFLNSSKVANNIELIITHQILTNYKDYEKLVGYKKVENVIDDLVNVDIPNLRKDIIKLIEPYHLGLNALNELLKGNLNQVDDFEKLYNKHKNIPLIMLPIVNEVTVQLSKQPQPLYYLIVNKIRAINDTNSPKKMFMDMCKMYLYYKENKSNTILTEPITLLNLDNNNEYSPKIVDIKELKYISPNYIDSTKFPSERVFEVLNQVGEILYEQLNSEITYYINNGKVSENSFREIDYLLEDYSNKMNIFYKNLQSRLSNLPYYLNTYTHLERLYINSLDKIEYDYHNIRKDLLSYVTSNEETDYLDGEIINKAVTHLNNLSGLSKLEKIVITGMLDDNIPFISNKNKLNLTDAIKEGNIPTINDHLTKNFIKPLFKELLLLQISTNPNYMKLYNLHQDKRPVQELSSDLPSIISKKPVQLNIEYLSNYFQSKSKDGLEVLEVVLHSSNELEDFKNYLYKIIDYNITQFKKEFIDNIYEMDIKDAKDAERSKRLMTLFKKENFTSDYLKVDIKQGKLPVFYITELFRNNFYQEYNIRCTINRVQLLNNKNEIVLDSKKLPSQTVPEYLTILRKQLSQFKIPNDYILLNYLNLANDLRRKVD